MTTQKRYQTCAPCSYGELERLAGITDRLAFWRQFRSEAPARAEIHARIERRIAAGEFSPLWPHTGRVEQPSVKAINAHVFAGTGSCYIDTRDGRRFRISRARTRKGIVEGRVICGSSREWEPIPAHASVEMI